MCFQVCLLMNLIPLSLHLIWALRLRWRFLLWTVLMCRFTTFCFLSSFHMYNIFFYLTRSFFMWFKVCLTNEFNSTLTAIDCEICSWDCCLFYGQDSHVSIHNILFLILFSLISHFSLLDSCSIFSCYFMLVTFFRVISCLLY